jgi:hypothetical protein
MWHWYKEEGGFGHVAAYLANLELSAFDPKEPPAKTEAFWAFANSHRAPENAELADIIDDLKNPDALTLDRVRSAAVGTDFAAWLDDRKNRRYIPHRFDSCGYVPVRNPDAEDGLWRINDKRQVVYTKKGMDLADQVNAARRLS